MRLACILELALLTEQEVDSNIGYMEEEGESLWFSSIGVSSFSLGVGYWLSPFGETMSDRFIVVFLCFHYLIYYD